MIKRIYRYTINKAVHYTNLILLTLIAVILDIGIFIGAPIVYDEYLGQTATNNKVAEIYRQIIVASGQSNNAVPLNIVESETYNAYTDGSQIVLYTGLINNSTWDGIAYILGHELAHHQLMHTRSEIFHDKVQTIEKAEALADKLGAFYMMKAGYDICVAREGWKKLRDTQGNYLGETHPNYSYRFDELDVNCEGK